MIRAAVAGWEPLELDTLQLGEPKGRMTCTGTCTAQYKQLRAEGINLSSGGRILPKVVLPAGSTISLASAWEELHLQL